MRSGERERDGRKVKIETRMEPELRDERVGSSSGGDGEGRREGRKRALCHSRQGRKKEREKQGWEREFAAAAVGWTLAHRTA